MNATECYERMLKAIVVHGATREVSDPTSPRKLMVTEAPFALQFRMAEPLDNVVGCRTVDRRWAVANLLHFFAATEQAGILRRYNKHADRFLDGDRWVGAYGAIAVPQLRQCISLLSQHPSSRRAIVSMGEMPLEATINIPACWSHLHLQMSHGKLDMHAYQRSLSLRVMPYDCVVLTNVLNFAADSCGFDTGELVWTVGNLHTDDADLLPRQETAAIVLDRELLQSSAKCYSTLLGGCDGLV